MALQYCDKDYDLNKKGTLPHRQLEKECLPLKNE